MFSRPVLSCPVENSVMRVMFSSFVLWNVLYGNECSLVLSCPVVRFESRGMFSGSDLRNVL